MSSTTDRLLQLFRDDPALAADLSTERLGEILSEHGIEPAATKGARVEQVTTLARQAPAGVRDGGEPPTVLVAPKRPEPDQPLATFPVTTQPARVKSTAGELLHFAVRNRTAAISFHEYDKFIEKVLCPPDEDGDEDDYYEVEPEGEDRRARKKDRLTRRAQSLTYFGVDAYQHLKKATELFLMCETGTVPSPPLSDERRAKNHETFRRLEHRGADDPQDLLDEYRKDYLRELGNDEPVGPVGTLPYFRRVISALGGLELKPAELVPPKCYGIVRSRVSPPCLLELIWSYWQEQGMLVQTMQAISQRFQNQRADSNPLAHLELDPLRPLNNLIWGHIQDEPHQLSLVRRAYEYDHHYGLRLEGKAVPKLRPADSRAHFLEAFHNLLHLAAVFFKEDDDTNYKADGFPVLNALKELHLILAQGAHNQFGDLPWQARVEMLIIQWLLARPEMREFLGGRAMVPYAEPWMGRVETMRSLQGWKGAGITHFRDLAVYGEEILLSVRYHDWVDIADSDEAVNWSKFWRPEIQAYLHAYRAVTGVDLTVDTISQQELRLRFAQPSELIMSRNGDRAPARQRA